MVEGISKLDTKDLARASLSELQIPEEFDQKKFAFKWCEEGPRVTQAQQQQFLIPGYAVDGWQVAKYKKGDHAGDVVKNSLKSGKTLVLMLRPKILQEAVNAVYGNISKARSQAEQAGTTLTSPDGTPIDQQGMLTNRRLENFEHDQAAQTPIYGPGGLTFNQVKPAESVPFGAEGLTPTRRRKK